MDITTIIALIIMFVVIDVAFWFITKGRNNGK